MIIEGSIVKARAGRDKDGFFVVLRLEGEYAFIADGKRRKVQCPKKKKLIHLQHTNSLAEKYSTNKEVKNTIREFGGL